MATFLQNLETRRAAIAAELAALTATAAGGKPNASGEGGGVDHVGYKDGLYRELAQIDELIKGYHESQAVTEGPFEIMEQGIP